MLRLISFMHQRQAGYTNGHGPSVPRLSAATQLAYAGILLVLTLTLMEPSGAYGLTWWQRAGFYAAHVAPAMVVAWVASGWLFNRQGLWHWPTWMLLALAGAAAGVALAPLSVTLEMALGVVDLDEPGAGPLPLTAEAWWTELADELLQVPPRTALFWVVMNLWVLWRAQQPQGELVKPVEAALPVLDAPPARAPTAPTPISAPTPASAAKAPALLDQLPARLGRDVVLLEAQQHYLRIVTARGEHLLLHGLAPAVAELAQRGIAGMQIHRSIWVAWAHVERLDVRPGSLAAVLRDGQRLPIGRRRLREVAEAWQQWPGQ